MNLGQFQTRVARVIGMSLASTADVALIDGWTNEAVVQLLRETKMHTRLGTLALTAGQGDYALDTDILSMQAAWYEPADTSDRRLMQALSPEAMMEARMPQNVTVSTPRYYAMSGAHTLLLHPAPNDADDVLHILYVPRPTAMSTTAHAPDVSPYGSIPEEYHPVLEAYVLWKAGRAEEHKGSDNGLQFQAEWETGLSRIRAELNRKAGSVMPPVRLGRQRRWPVGNGVDLGY